MLSRVQDLRLREKKVSALLVSEERVPSFERLWKETNFEFYEQ